MLQRFQKIWLLLAVLVAISCSPGSGEENQASQYPEQSPTHDASDLKTEEQSTEAQATEEDLLEDQKGMIPEHITGSHLTYDNARARCEFKKEAGRQAERPPRKA